MLQSGNWLVARRLVATIIYKLVRFVFITVQHIYWQLNGTAQKLCEARLPHNYDWSAQVLDIVLCYKFCPGLLTTVDDFLCTHSCFENPQFIIDNDNITLLTVTDHDAIFCEAKEKDMHLWSLKYDAFISNAQTKYCRRLIVVPLTTFHRLAETIGDPTGEMTFLFHRPRSGSTLLVQIMEYTGRCVTVSEPTSLNLLAVKYRRFGDSRELQQLARDVIRWECRPYQTLQPPPLGYFIKLTSISTVALPLFRELFPCSRCLFMYRDVEKVAKSVYRISLVLPSGRLLFLLGRLSGRVTKMVLDKMGYEGSDYAERLDNDLKPGILLSAVTTAAYISARRSGFEVHALRYEDLVARPLDMCRVILDYCRMPVSLADLAVKAFDVDSQRSSVLAKSIISQFKEPEMTPQLRLKLNKLLKQYGMPLIGEPDIIEGTLTCT